MRRILTVLALAVAAIAALAISPVAQVDAQQNATWQLEFFDNPYLVGPPVYTTQTQGIGYNWGDGSPNAAVPANNFSARFSTDVVIPAGTYRFYMLADDGAHLYVEFNSVINTFENPQPGQVQQTDVTVPGGEVHIQIDFREYDSSAYFYLDWQNLATNPTGPDFGQVGSQPTPGGQWTATYYNNTSLTGSPVITRSETAPNHNWGTASPIAPVTADNFSVRWQTVQSLNQGTYQLSVRADDGVRVYVDGVLRINEWHPATGETYTSTFGLNAGNHSITVEYYEANGIASISYALEPISTPPTTGVWTAQYFNNRDLAGTPIVTQNENAPERNWGTAAPFGSLPADNFSVRWRTTEFLEQGNYTISVRADDGVRVYVDGVLRINEWHIASGVTYTDTFFVQRGNHTITVEYFEANGLASISYELESGSAAPPPGDPTGATGTVIAFRLNVRNAPSVANGDIVAKISLGQSFPVIGRNSDASWWLIRLDGGLRGWVSDAYFRVSDTAGVPIVGDGADPAPTGLVVTTTANLNIRVGPSLSNDRIGVIPVGTTVTLRGRNFDATWWLIEYAGVTGWVSARYAELPPSTSINQVPIVN